jgi:hypothetical protein
VNAKRPGRPQAYRILPNPCEDCGKQIVRRGTSSRYCLECAVKRIDKVKTRAYKKRPR